MFSGSYRTTCLCSRTISWHIAAIRRFEFPKSTRWLNTGATVRERVSGIWYVPEAASTDYKDVVAKLPKLLSSTRQHLQMAIFFATPSTASWFAPGHEFLELAMNHIFSPVLDNSAPTSIVAVVDALPSSKLLKVGAKSLNRNVVYGGAEGVALCLLPASDSHVPASSGTNELPLVKFRSKIETATDGKQYLASASLQIANTLFVNGSKSTMFRNRWTAINDAGGLRLQTQEPPEMLNGLNIPVERAANHFLAFTNHFQAITQPRHIVSSMGNVVRELQADDGSNMKASTELETLVPEFLRKKEAELGPGRVEVYALLMPPQNMVGFVKGDSQEQEPKPRSLSQRQNLDSTSLTSTLIHSALWHGGRLHKVTGGGGGWGKKAGLLSLEISVNFEDSSQFEISMFPSFDENNDVETRQAHATQEAIPLGWSMQFLATFIGAEQSPYIHEHKPEALSEPDAKDWTWLRGFNNLVIGVTDPKDEHITNESSGTHASRTISIGHKGFGMLSANGICLSVESVRPSNMVASDSEVNESVLHQFRVDAPQTTFRASWRDPPINRDNSELDEVPKFRSSDPEQGKTLGPIIDDAIKQSRRQLVRKVKFQPIPNFEIPRWGRRAKQAEVVRRVTITEKQEPRIWRYNSLKGGTPDKSNKKPEPHKSERS